MNKHNLIFQLNDTEKIVVELDASIDGVNCCTEAPIVFFQGSKKVILSEDAVRNNMIILSNLLTKALKNKLQLHESITQDIGYLFNQYSDYLCDDTSTVQNNFGYTKLDGRDTWAGNNYSLWNSDLASWIYNDVDGSIIFELTPIYPEDFFYTKNEPPILRQRLRRARQTVPYQEWIKGYAPYLITTIPHNVAQQWLEQADSIVKQIDESTAKLRSIKK